MGDIAAPRRSWIAPGTTPDKLRAFLTGLRRYDQAVDPFAPTASPPPPILLEPGSAQTILETLAEEGFNMVLRGGRLAWQSSRPVPFWLNRLLREERDGLLRYFELKQSLAQAPRGSVVSAGWYLGTGSASNQPQGRLNVRRQRGLLARLRSARESNAGLTYLTELLGLIPALPLRSGDKAFLEGYFAPQVATPLDLYAVERRFAGIRKRLAAHRGRGRPLLVRFLRLVDLAFAGGLAKMIGMTVYPRSMESLRLRFEAGDRAALGAALAAIDGDKPLADPAAIEEEWVRKGIFRVAREHLPQKGRGGTPSGTLAERRAKSRESVAVSRAVPRLLARWDKLVADGADPDQARRDVEENFRLKSRVRDDRRDRVLREFRRRVKKVIRTLPSNSPVPLRYPASGKLPKLTGKSEAIS